MGAEGHGAGWTKGGKKNQNLIPGDGEAGLLVCLELALS